MLVIEDDADIRAIVRIFLEAQGYAVSTAADGRPAMARLDASRVGLIVLLDLTMPQMDGIAVLEEAERLGDLLQRDAFVLVTARARRTMPLPLDTRLQALDVPVLPKPLDFNEVSAAVQEADT